VGRAQNKSGQQGHDASDHPLRYIDRKIYGAITDSVSCKAVVTEPRVGDNPLHILPGRREQWKDQEIGVLDVAADRALR